MTVHVAAINLCNLPPWAIASHHFNAHPQRLDIQGVRHAHRLLFTQLEQLDTREMRGLQFVITSYSIHYT